MTAADVGGAADAVVAVAVVAADAAVNIDADLQLCFQMNEVKVEDT